MNQFNDQLTVGLLAQLVRALHRYRRGPGSNPGKPDFFRLSFRNCISCVNNFKDLLYINFMKTLLHECTIIGDSLPLTKKKSGNFGWNVR